MNRRGFLGALLALPSAIKAAISSPAIVASPIPSIPQIAPGMLVEQYVARESTVWAVVTGVVLPGDLLTSNSDGTLRTARSESEFPVGVALDRASGEGVRVKVAIL